MPIRPRIAALAAATVVVLTGGVVALTQHEPAGPDGPAGPSAAYPTPPASASAVGSPSAAWTPSTPATDEGVWMSWAYLDSIDGTMSTGGAAGTTPTASMIKPAIVSDYLRGRDQAITDPTPDETARMTAAIVDSDDAATEWLYRERGSDVAVQRIIKLCGMTGAQVHPGWWSKTQVTAPDSARMGACIRDGGLVSEPWPTWVLDRMREVRGEGRFGIGDSRRDPDGGALAIKNGWMVTDGLWHVNCLAVGGWWSGAVLTRYPASRGLGYGAKLCADVARSVFPPDMRPAPEDSPAPEPTNIQQITQ